MAQPEDQKGSSQGTGDGNPGTDEGKFKDVEDLVNAKVNAAISTHLGRFRQSFEKDLTANISKMMEPITGKLESFGELAEKLQNPSEGDQGQQTSQELEELKKAQARIAELERKNQEAEAAAQATERKRLQAEERNALTQALRNSGIEDTRIRAAVSLIYNEDQRVGRAEDGSIIFKVPKAGYTDEVTLDEGLADWLKTDEGKAFLPARSAIGSGGRPSPAGRRGPASGAEKKAEARQLLAQMMMGDGRGQGE